jgi:hypothetical protein
MNDVRAYSKVKSVILVSAKRISRLTQLFTFGQHFVMGDVILRNLCLSRD